MRRLMISTFRNAFYEPIKQRQTHVWFVRLTLLLSLTLACNASRAAPETELKLSTLAGSPIAAGQGGSSRVSLEPSLKWALQTTTLRTRVRMRHLRSRGQARLDTDVRELSAEWSDPEWTLRLGAQQINWGRMDLLPITDTINPLDQNDVFLEDLPEAKRALWMLNLEWQRGEHALQWIVSPQIPIDRLRTDPETPPITLTSPSPSFANTTFAVRYGTTALGWNTDFIAQRGWRSTPQITLLKDPQGTLTLQGHPTQHHSLGLSADRPWGRTIMRLEAQITQPFSLTEPTQSNLPRALGVGLDLPWRAWLIAAQIIHHNTHPGSQQPESTYFTSLIAQRTFFMNQLALRAITLFEYPGHASWASFQLRYEWSPRSVLQLQTDHFQGPTDTLLGRMHAQSRIAAAISWQL
jgi:hypothetical protein